MDRMMSLMRKKRKAVRMMVLVMRIHVMMKRIRNRNLLLSNPRYMHIRQLSVNIKVQMLALGNILLEWQRSRILRRYRFVF
jgi:hypothetical protein